MKAIQITYTPLLPSTSAPLARTTPLQTTAGRYKPSCSHLAAEGPMRSSRSSRRCDYVEILEYLSERQRPWAQAILRRAYRSADVKAAQRFLDDLANRLEPEHPSAAESVREGLDETSPCSP